MTRKEMRIRVAKDVLARAATMQWSTLDYFAFSTGEDGGNEEIKSEEDIEFGCRVCAIGGMLVSLFRVQQKDLVASVNSMLGGNVDGERQMMSYDIRNELSSCFSKVQLALIESAFQCAEISSGAKVSMRKLRKAADMYQQPEHSYLSTRQYRIRRIMMNIIDNDGTFVVK